MADSIFDKYRNLDTSTAETSGSKGNIFDKYRSATSELVPPPENPVYSKSLEAGIIRGATDVSDTIAQGIEPALESVGISSTLDKRKVRREQYEKEYGNDTVADIGRIGSQAAITAPVVPSRAIANIASRIGSGAINRLGASMTTGAAGGIAYGTGINSTNEKGLGQNIGENAALGAVGAPIISGAGRLGSMVVPGFRSLKANIYVLNAARDAGLPASAIKNVVQRLEDAGLTPEQATLELNRLGSKATIADLDPSLTTEASGLAALGGKPTAILKNRFSDRAEQANSAATNLVASRLGPKPDMEVEKQKIIDRAQILTGPDYKAAKASGTKLDTSNVVAHIDSELDKAVGAEASQLARAKEYLYNSKDELKTDVASLHKVRQALDDTLSRLPKEGTSQGTATYRAVSTIRDLVDSKLKSVPEMAAADAKFAQHMNIKSGLQIGYDALTKKTNKDEFIKVFNAASPEMQDTIRKGLHSAMIDVMEHSGQGDATGMQRLLNKKTVNKEIVRTAFGTKGESIIDAVHDEVAQRGTERAVTQGSQTAERTAIRERYEGKGEPHLGDISFGAAMDALGSGGVATAATVVKRGISNRIVARSENRLGALTEGTADLLSRQGAERDVGMQVIDQVSKIQDRLSKRSILERISLPKIPTLAAPFGGKAYDQIK